MATKGYDLDSRVERVYGQLVPAVQLTLRDGGGDGPEPPLEAIAYARSLPPSLEWRTNINHVRAEEYGLLPPDPAEPLDPGQRIGFTELAPAVQADILAALAVRQRELRGIQRDCRDRSLDKTYTGTRNQGGTSVLVDGRDLGRDTEYGWGPKVFLSGERLARTLLADFFGPDNEEAVAKLCQPFARDIVANLGHDDWTLAGRDIWRWAKLALDRFG